MSMFNMKLRMIILQLSKTGEKNNPKIEFPQRGPQDFFTYFFDDELTKNGYWSGYYTSWPLLKGSIAKAQRNLRAFEMANMLFHGKSQTYNTDLNVLRDAFGITVKTGKREYLDLDTQAIPANYHPFPSAAWINGTNTNTKNEEEILLITERVHGAGSINEGQIEIMVARRTLQDGGFGLGMPLVDTMEFKTKLWLSIDTHYSNKNKRQKAATILPLFSDNLHMRSSYPVISKSSEWSTKFLTEKSELCITLPGYIHILTISKTFDQQSKGILRIQHLSEFDEGSPYTVNLNKLFSCSRTFNPSIFQEMSLSLSNTIDTCHSSNKNIKPNPKTVSEITIKPMEIRTFIFDYSN
ncbi:alpha-mannosidase [Anaeramoeba flamelloides]|uniref:Alpha-mannosidase n=1 Tax=Anaeramoeba flamelloides TaxID=1746091 RepID=A0AAV7YHI5_9EUKA|nr:alpha-mannosidase [Anaeramoeba flamelloides]